MFVLTALGVCAAVRLVIYTLASRYALMKMMTGVELQMDATAETYAGTFKEHLERYDREGSVQYCLALLEQGKISVPELYEQILAPALNSLLVGRDSEHDAIWREHVMTNIVRHVIELSAPYVARESAKVEAFAKKPRVMLVCPEEEYHDLGVRMGLDFFIIAGFDATYIGANTPKSNIISAAKALHPDIVGISVSNYLNLFALEKIIPELKREIGLDVRILLSGSAVRHTGRAAEDFSADGVVNSFRDIMDLRGLGA